MVLFNKRIMYKDGLKQGLKLFILCIIAYGNLRKQVKAKNIK